MADTTLNTRVVLRNDSAGNWSAADVDSNLVLLKGEIGIEYDATGKVKMKVGDGVTNWSALKYFGGNDSKVFQVSSYEELELQADVNIGDTGIVKTLISDDKYSHTGYVYTENGWAAMDGNYNASNVYFDEDITYTANIGAVELESGKSSGTFNAKGKSLETILKNLMALTKAPAISAPTFSMSVSRTTDTGNLELGSKIKTFTWNGTYADGSYEYGYLNADGSVNNNTAAGCTATYSVSSSVAGTKSGDTEDGTWTITDPITIDSESSKTYGSITNECTYSESSRTPVNNIGEAVDGQIASSSITQTKSISLTGYREGYFYGSLTTAKPASELTSADIRGLSKSGAKYAKGSKSYTVPVGAAMVIFACPKTATGVTDVLNTTVNANMNDAFGLSNPTVVSVQGANGYSAVDYNVWTFTPAEAYGSTAALTITLG